MGESEAVALYDYNAQEHDELTLQKGDIITDIIIQPGGWWEGKLKGKRGMFPDNFVKLKGGDAAKAVQPEVANRIGTGRKCKVLFSYHPENSDELKLKVNDIIEILDEVEEGWWKGKLRDEVGVFPSNFVSEVSDEKLESESEPTEMKKSKPTQVESLKPNETATNHKDASLSSSRSTSVSTDSEVPLLPPKPVKEMCKVIFPYKAANDDELTLKEGEIITILSKEVQDKGWWKGELNGHIGMFPDNFVQLLPIDESSKPARPPVKGATTNRTRDSLTKPTTLSSSASEAVTPTTTHLPDTHEPTVKNDKPSLPGIVSKKPTPPPPSKKPPRTHSGSMKPPAPTSPTYSADGASEATSPLQPKSVKPSETPPTGVKAKSPVPSTTSAKPTVSPHEVSPLRSPRPTPLSHHSEVDGSCLSVGASPRSYNLNNSNHGASAVNPIEAARASDNVTPRSYNLNHSGASDSSAANVTPRSHNLNHSGASDSSAANPSDADLDFDSIGRTAMLTHPTASRVRAPRRRPPSSIMSKDENTSPSGMMNGSADSHLEKQPTAAMSLVEELKLNYAKKQSGQGVVAGRTRVMIGQSGGGDSPEQPMPAKSPSGAAGGGVVLRSSPSSAPAVTPPRPQSMFSPSPRPSPSPVADTVTLTIKQWTEINDKVRLIIYIAIFLFRTTFEYK
ncbi:CD2-associated protein isoform X2 [Nilaparvata lugens]|uniref:CD2-associated protein isoform X2 n=1 Tax=Nilaparvata lugens TaxID=108931 RepID=UPI00193D504C|nr:CD2-associated protein isoform X2 [Nilaparvata lugens]